MNIMFFMNKTRQQTYRERIVRIVLAMALVFAAVHVALHELDSSADINSHECQTCRINHLPVADLPTLSLTVPMLLLSLILIITVFQHRSQSHHYINSARAPPLF